jgi:uncharacterized membrane protein
MVFGGILAGYGMGRCGRRPVGRVGVLHGLGNVVVVALFAVSWLFRASADGWKPGVLALIFSFAGVVLAGLTGWLGGELVERLGVGVDAGADVNAPSSLTNKHAQSADRAPGRVVG